ncbi:hypothetical protein [Actinomadura roseirufa]|uniref:hypothetical protein n=1 Tax=Actinomadura roseirufa TaxID=2094049 RepID=UPI0010411034|nr:hypothetical protein [Actinomadura roseirufa]
MGVVLVAAGLVAPAAGQATALGDGKVVVRPGLARPGQRAELTVHGCPDGQRGRSATSPAFAGRVSLDGTGDRAAGTAGVRRDARDGTYPIRVRCGLRTLHGQFRVTTRPAWPVVLRPSGTNL